MEKHAHMNSLKKFGAGVLAALMLVVMCSVGFSTTVFAESGKTYYVAADGKDDNDGLSLGTPLSLKKANQMLFSGGDSILFKRGDVFYGTFSPMVYKTDENNRVTVGSYGNGALPQISAAKIIESKWMKVSGGFYRYTLGKAGNYSGLKDDNANVAFMADSANKKWGVRKLSAAACTNEYDFYCDETSIYVKTDADPYEKLGKLILAVNAAGVQVSSFMNVHDLHIRYVGSHGINQKSSNSSYVHIYDCVIEDVGGSQLDEDSKYGNGIEFYGGASHILIENNIIRNTYDVGFTLQGGGSCVWKDITVRKNVFAYNTQSFEMWTNAKGAGQGIDGLSFENNICINQGEGWGTLARPDKSSSGGQVKMTDVLVYEYSAPVLNLSMKGNTFYNRNEANRVYSISTVGTAFFTKAKIDNNYVYLPQSSSICMSTDNGMGAHSGKKVAFADWQSQYGLDKNSSFTAIGANASKYANMESVALTLLSLRDIVKAVKAAGVATNITDADLTPKTTTTATTTAVSTTTTNGANKNTSAGASTTTTQGNADAGQTSTSSTTEPSATVATDFPVNNDGGSLGWIIVIVVLAGAGVAVFVILKKKQKA